MKIGIITIHKTTLNYGACLQCFALWQYLTWLEHDVEVIDLHRPVFPDYKYGKYHKKDSLRNRLRNFISILLGRSKKLKIEKNERFNNFKKFNQKIKYSKSYYSIDEIYASSPKYDVYISGSDQIWNPNLPIYTPAYMLDFAPKDAKRIAYASSFAVDYLEDNTKQEYKKYLEKYSYLSVREKQGVKIIDEIGGLQPAKHVLDPSFLLTRVQWNNLAGKKYTDKYVFVYTLNEVLAVDDYAREIAKHNNLEVKKVMANYNAEIFKDFESLVDIGPIEWLSYMRDASMIVTNSFHCCVFAIIFNKPFKVICTNVSLSSRIVGLLEDLELMEYFSFVDKINYSENSIPDIDYKKVKERLDVYLSKSYEYLDTALK